MTFGSTQGTSQLVVKQALVGSIPRVQCLLLKVKPKPLRSPCLSSYRFVVNRELILSPDPKGKFILLLQMLQLPASISGSHAPILFAFQDSAVRMSERHITPLNRIRVTVSQVDRVAALKRVMGDMYPVAGSRVAGLHSAWSKLHLEVSSPGLPSPGFPRWQFDQ